MSRSRTGAGPGQNQSRTGEPRGVAVVSGGLLHAAAVVPQHLALLTQVLRVLLALVRHVQPVRLLQGPLLVWVNVDVALDALLPHVGPGVPAHPLPLALGAFVLSEAPLLALVRGQAFPLRPGLRAVFDVVSLVEAQVAQVVGRRPLAGFPRLGGEGQVGEVVGQRAQAVHDVVERAAGGGAFIRPVTQGLIPLQLKEVVEIVGI